MSLLISFLGSVVMGSRFPREAASAPFRRRIEEKFGWACKVPGHLEKATLQ